MKESGSTIGRRRPVRDPRLTAINFVADAVNRSVELKEIAENALHAIISLNKADGAALYLWQAADESLRLFVSRGISEAFVRQVAIVHKGADATMDAVLAGDTKVIEDFTLAPNFFGFDAVRAGFESAMLSPVRAQGFVVGVLVLGKYKKRRFEDNDVELVEGITNQIGNALVHAQLEADIRASGEQYRGLVENSDDAIYIAGMDGRPRFANSAFRRVFGFEAEELSALDPFDLVHSEDVEGLRAAFAKLQAGESIHGLEYRFCHKDGQWIDLQCNAGVFSREEKRPVEFQFVVRDVTEMRQRHQQLLRRNRQLSALTTLAGVANTSLNIQEIARNTLEVALESTGSDGGGLHVIGGDGRSRVYVQANLPDALANEIALLRWDGQMRGIVVGPGQINMPAHLTAGAMQLGDVAEAHGFKVVVAVPVRVRGEVLGTLCLGSKRDVQFTPETVEMVTAMGNQLGIAMANARLYEGQLRENEKLNALLDISSVGAQWLELDPLLQRILDRAAALLKADGGYIVRDRGEEAEVVAATDELRALRGSRHSRTEGIAGQIRNQRTGRIYTAEDVARYGASRVLRRANVRSLLAVPLVARNRVIGSIALVRENESANEFTPVDLELMEAFASRAAVAIDNAQLLDDLSRKNNLLELLIEEAHHRIKNNLQMVSGLLQLESGSGESSEQLQQAIARIHAIAQVHNLLSEEMPDEVDAHTLIHTIVNTLITSSGGEHSLVTLEIEHLRLTAEQAVPVSLIVNELVANALLHCQAPSEGKLEVRVQCRQEDKRARLTVSDNGGGLPPGFDPFQSDGQGMNIVAQLARVNLRGQLTIQNQDGGVRSELTFDLAGEMNHRKTEEIPALVRSEA